MRTDLAQGLRDALKSFAGREIAAAIRLATSARAVDTDVDAMRGRLELLRERLLSRPGMVSGKPDLVQRWTYAPRAKSSERLMLWGLSRACLLEVADRLYSAADTSAPGATMLLSLAHTRGMAISAGTLVRPGERPHLVGIGVDCEPQGRMPSAETMRRVAHPDDHLGSLDSITIWAAKEACLKADPRPGMELSAYALKCYREIGEGGPLQAIGDQVDFRVFVSGLQSFRVAVAMAYASHPLAVVHERG